jgi:adenylate cyclase
VLLARLAETCGDAGDASSRLPAGELEALRRTLDEYLTPPRMVLFAGHMIDLPGRPTPRFPAAREAWMQAEIARQLAERHVGFGFSAAACGADILFLEALRARGGETHIVLPFSREEFRRRSVVRVPEHARWGERFDRALDAATTYAELSDSFCLSAENAVNYANRVLHGRALWRAVEFDTSLGALAAWDGRQEGDTIREGGGGTQDCVRQWQAHGCQVEIISLAPDDGTVAEVSSEGGDNAGTNGAKRIDEAIRATLCGEWAPPAAAGLRSEKRRLAARRAFFARVAKLLEPFQPALLDLTVEGDRFRLLFGELLPAARTARALRAGLAAAVAGSSRRFAVRLGLHAGPVARMENALLGGHAEPVGTHWQKAERLASLAAPGRIILSREAAALLAVETHGRGTAADDDWHCEYQGRGAFGEPFGRQGIYAL